ncbi:enoyl-CoA hydratase [uncultured Paracoccus sp.]|uniref:enoyl-CoA hydratase n=1 Tax=uncultured Paracoccus sp. TaxID=189685 RepID=UPI0025EFD5D5|nr:enoyl-CoA hydratase [uncultured Paracoccus sp.]
MPDLILRQDSNHIARLVLNSPDNYNALSLNMIDALADTLRQIGDNEGIRVVVLAAQGKAFCAGHDLRQMQAARDEADGGAAAFADLFDRCALMMQMIPALPQPVIAEVQGIATAAGCQLVASCDMAVASDSARFGVNGVNIGLFCATPMVALTRAVPPKAAFEMLTTGDFIDADRAQQLGLVNRVTAPGALTGTAMQMAATIASKLPAAIRLGKRAFHDQLRLGTADAYATAGQAMCRNILLTDTAEGMAAFLEKRPPNWA